jgi:hypothetical protein
MTTNQAIAMVFPVFTAVAVLATAYGVKAWVQRQRTQPNILRSSDPEANDPFRERETKRAVSDNLAIADAIIQQARRDLQRAN